MKLEEDFRSGVVNQTPKHTQIFPVSKNAILHVSRVFLVAGMHSQYRKKAGIGMAMEGYAVDEVLSIAVDLQQGR
jgi:hypothetical protein